MRRLVAVAVAATVALGFLPPIARAAGPSVTLAASPQTVAYGETVTLTGTIDPAAVGESVEIRDETETVLATAPTDGTGAFAATLTLERSTALPVEAVRAVAGELPVTRSGVRR